jgi:hypothetical protein
MGKFIPVSAARLGNKKGMISAFVHRHTRCRGAGGKYGDAHTLCIVPVMQWFQRNIAWITGEASIFLLIHKLKNIIILSSNHNFYFIISKRGGSSRKCYS